MGSIHKKNLVVGSLGYRAHKQILLVYTEKSNNTVGSVHKKNLWGSTNTGPANRFFLCTHPTNRIFLCTDPTGLLNNSKNQRIQRIRKIKKASPPSGRGGRQSTRLTGSSLYRGDALSPLDREGVFFLFINRRDTLALVYRRSLSPLYIGERQESLPFLYTGEIFSPLYREGVCLVSTEAESLSSLYRGEKRTRCTHPTNRIFLCTDPTGLLNNFKNSKNSNKSKNSKKPPLHPAGEGANLPG